LGSSSQTRAVQMCVFFVRVVLPKQINEDTLEGSIVKYVEGEGSNGRVAASQVEVMSKQRTKMEDEIAKLKKALKEETVQNFVKKMTTVVKKEKTEKNVDVKKEKEKKTDTEKKKKKRKYVSGNTSSDS
jgi:hypothetical protein